MTILYPQSSLKFKLLAQRHWPYSKNSEHQ